MSCQTMSCVYTQMISSRQCCNKICLVTCSYISCSIGTIGVFLVSDVTVLLMLLIMMVTVFRPRSYAAPSTTTHEDRVVNQHLRRSSSQVIIQSALHAGSDVIGLYMISSLCFHS